MNTFLFVSLILPMGLAVWAVAVAMLIVVYRMIREKL